MTSAPKILIVDDEEHIRKILTIMLSKKGYQPRPRPMGRPPSSWCARRLLTR